LLLTSVISSHPGQSTLSHLQPPWTGHPSNFWAILVNSSSSPWLQEVSGQTSQLNSIKASHDMSQGILHIT